MLLSIRHYLSRELKYIVHGVILAVTLAIIFSLMLFGGTKLAMGPLYRTSSTAQCQQKYAKAVTMAETTTVDFLPHADSTGRRGSRCGFTRSVALSEIK